MLLASLALVALIGACAIGLVVGLWLSSPRQTVIGAPPADLAAETVQFRSTSGATIHGWFVQGRPGGGGVVLLHGVHGNRLQMVRRARLMRAAGFFVLLFDFQAHGESIGRRITFGYLEGRDAVAAVAYVRQRLPDEKVGAIGLSLGGAAALLAPGGLAVDALVLEAVYPDIGAATANRVTVVLGAQLGTFASRPSAFLLQMLMAPILGVWPSDLAPIERIADVRAPVLIVGGARDEMTTIAETNAIFARAHEPKLLWAVEDAGHFDFEAHAPEQYRNRVVPFLRDALQPN